MPPRLAASARSSGPAAATLTAAFASGGAVLSLELLAAAQLAAVFGSGLDVWASILATTLGAMAVGYLLGSVRTARWARPARAAGLTALAGLAVVAGVIGARYALAADARCGTTGSGALLAATSLLLGPAVTLLALLGPWLVELHHRASGLSAAGRSAGLTYAASTLGGVVCALGAGLHAIPCWGLTRTALAVVLLLAAGALALVATGGRDRAGRRTAQASLLALLLAVVGLLRAAPPEPPPDLLEEAIGLHGHVSVTDDGLHRTLWVNGIPQTRTPSSALEILADGSLLERGNALGVLPFLRPGARSALLVGLGGGLVAKALEDDGWQVDAVEIDPRVLDMARRYFAFQGSCTVSDGRRYLLQSRRRYDVVVVDVYRGEHLPPHLVTLEFFELLRSRLEEGGLVAMNLIGTARAPDVLALVRTVQHAFAHLRLLAIPDVGVGPMTLLAATSSIEDPSTRDRLRAAGLAFPAAVDLDALPLGSAPILTDDRNPILRLRRPTARAWRASALRLRPGPEASGAPR